MAILAEGGITLTSVNDACSVLLSPSSCAIHADYDGSNPKLNTAFTDINVIRGNVKLPISSSNVSVMAKSDSGITCVFQTVNSFTQRLLITALPSTILNGSIQIQVTYDSLIMTPTFVFSVERESTMLAWIQDWETRKTQIGSEFIITPKFFAGKKEADNSLTGVYVGPDTTNGAGIYGYHAGTEIFHLNETGGSIGGWNIQNGGISTSDGKLRILSEGSIVSLDSDDEVIYGLYKSGEATFANGNVLFHADGSASFKGSITAEGGTIAGWNIASRAIWKSHILLDSLTNYIGLGPAEITNTNLADNTYSHRNAVQTSGGISMFYTSANAYGIEGYLPAVSGQSKLVFKLGDVNKIAGWTFDVSSLVSNYVTLTNQTNNAGAYFSADDISEVASSGLSAHINSGTGVYIKAGSGVVELAGVVSGTTVFKLGTSGNQIAGWSFSNTAIWTGSATVQNGFTTTANSMVLTGTGIYGYKWGLNADGSGKLAGGKIAWSVVNGVCQVDIDGALSVNDSITTDGLVLSKALMAKDGQGTIKAGMTAEGNGDSNVRFWAGKTYAQRISAPFRVTQAGKLFASDAEISGKVTATSGVMTDLTIKRTKNPFSYLDPSIGWWDDDDPESEFVNDDTTYSDLSGGLTVYNHKILPCDLNQAGRRIVNVGSIELAVPSGYFIYVNGKQYQSIEFINEIVELIGFGSETQFWGWILISRSYYKTTYSYGRAMHPLACGEVTTSSSGASFSLSKTFDGSKLYVSRESEGNYTLYLPYAWFAESRYIYCGLTGVNNSGGVGRVKPCIESITSKSYTPSGESARTMWAIAISLSDDATENEGGFQFMIYNMNEW